MTSTLTVIGIDPGLAATGFGIVCGRGMAVERFRYGMVRTPAATALPERLDQIFSALHRILQQEQPDLMVVEDVFSLDRYPKSGITLGKVTGVILVAGCRFGIPVAEIPVREAKRVLTGNGNASKSQLERAVRRLLNVRDPIKPDHASDALGLAVIGLSRYGDRHRLGRKGPGRRRTAI